MDSVYQQAVAKRAALQKQREAIDAELEQLASFLDMYGKLASAKAGAVAGKPGRRPGGKNAAKGTRRYCRTVPAPRILAESLKILERGFHCTTRGVLDALREEGFDVKGKTDTMKVVNLSSILGRARERDGTVKFDRETRTWSYADQAPKSKSPVDVAATTGLELRGNSSPAST